MDVSTIVAILGVAALLLLLWLNTLATIAVRCDQTIEKFQRIAQVVFVWLIPFIGASVVLHIVYEHSPEAIPRSWIPWPFKSLIYGAPIKENRNRDDMEPIDTHLRQRDASSGFGGDGGD